MTLVFLANYHYTFAFLNTFHSISWIGNRLGCILLHWYIVNSVKGLGNTNINTVVVVSNHVLGIFENYHCIFTFTAYVSLNLFNQEINWLYAIPLSLVLGTSDLSGIFCSPLIQYPICYPSCANILRHVIMGILRIITHITVIAPDPLHNSDPTFIATCVRLEDRSEERPQALHVV